MNIYGIYNVKYCEQCVRVGTLQEIVKFLNLTARQIELALNKNKIVMQKYKIYFLFREETNESRF